MTESTVEQEPQPDRGPSGDEDVESESSSQANSTPEHAPTKPLPSSRAKIESQVGYLRAFGAKGGPSCNVVAVPEVATMVGVHASTVSGCNAFFSDCGFIEKSGRGYKPAIELYEYNRAWQWDPNTAAHKLAPVVRQTWFWKALSDRLSFKCLTDAQAIEALADASSAGPDCRSQLEMLIELLALTGVVTRNDGEIHLVLAKHGGAEKGKQPEAVNPVEPAREQASSPPASSGNTMSLSMSISVPMDTLSKWKNPQYVNEFFATWAKLVNAKAEIEAMMRGEFPSSQSRTGGDGTRAE
ncbi:MAG: hypothetical protein HQ495_16140 [Alphaproteobacteria bacterium]|nr:hypothetical protein [Alphaproteobacteria bacterium]